VLEHDALPRRHHIPRAKRRSPFREKQNDLSNLFAARAALACCGFAGAWKRTAAHGRVVVVDDESIMVKKRGLCEARKKTNRRKGKRKNADLVELKQL
jgi:hypothetical protein